MALSDLLEERRASRRSEERPHRDKTEAGRISAVVVRQENEKDVILEVHVILGIAKVELSKLHPPSRAGVRGTLVVQERVTELLEIDSLLERMPQVPGLEPALVGAEVGEDHGR